MSKELVISSNRHETRVAVLEDDQLVEIYFQRSNEYSLAGSIHKGRVTRVLPGMQSAFVDLGLDRDTFLYVSDFFEENEEYDRIGGDEKPARSPRYQAPVAVPPVVPPPAAAAATAVILPEPIVEDIVEPASAVAAPAGGSEPRGGDRGRRSRRRRGRSRGFPDSKYASASSTAAEPAAEEPEIIEPRQDRDVILLPGESLAKYGRSHEAEHAIEEAVEHDTQPDEPSDEAFEEPIPVAVVDEPEESLLHVGGFPETSYVEPPASSAATEPEDVLTAQLADEPAPEQEPESELLEFTEPFSGDDLPGYSAAEDRAIEELEAAIAAAEAEESGNYVEELTHAASADQAAAESGSQPRTADVRERDNRQLHRGGRRMRRRGRGERGDRGERTDRGADRPPVVAGAEPVAGEIAVAAAPAPRRQERQDRQDRQDRPLTPSPSITDMLREGQEIIVQIAKEPLGQKGARITSHIAMPGRFVVYMPTLDHLGVSRKIASDEERHRLKRILQAHRSGITGGYIVRTAGEGRSEEEIAADMSFLYNLWLDIRQKAEKKPAPLLLHHDLEIVQRILRDQLTDSFKSIWVDSEELYESVLRFMQRFQPALVSRVRMYTRPTPIFDTFNITAELEKALRPKVWLRSGGYIVVNQTEALVAIDVNTGKYVGKSNRLEDTITKTNTEAVREIVRQIRLRDLGGIIVVDFIDMDERKNRQKVMQVLEEAMRADKAPYKILQFNDFGLVAITRKRVKQSLERALCAPCAACEGSGYVKSVQTVVGEILVEANKISSMVEGKNVCLRTHPDVAKFLKQNTNKYLEELEEILGRPVVVTSDPTLTQEKFDLA